MANTPAKKTTQDTATKEKEIDAAKMQKENDELKKTLEEMKAQIALLTQAQAAQTNVASQAPKRPERNISIINLTPGTLVLRGNQIYNIVMSPTPNLLKKMTWTPYTRRFLMTHS